MTTVDMTNEYQRQYTQCVTLKAHVKMLKIGMKNSRLSKTKIMELAREASGAQFGLRDYDGAIRALEKRRDALLVYIQNDG